MPNRKKTVIRAIASDWGKVVVDFDNDKVGRALDLHSSHFHAPYITEIMFKEQRELFDVYMRGQLTTDGYRRAMKRALHLTCTDAAFDAAFADVFTLNEPIVALWKRLRAQGVKMVAASNVEELRHAKLKEMGVHDLFDKHCLSYQVGVGKPDPAFFHKVAEMAYIEPEELLFVDDHPEFVEVARDQLITGFTYDINDHAAFEAFLEGVEFRSYRLS
ncbi:MAG TPA: HAD-IA family hydrolase [Patescibacteria group bacterium]|nr:HAD-IA family hydrolase [Patescibacteria group bacterium]